MKKSKIVLGLVGEMASGKGTISDYLAKKYNASCFKFSSPIRDVLERLHIEVNRRNLSETTTSLRKIFGEDFLVYTLIKDIKNDKNNIIVIDGFRKLSEVRLFYNIPGFILIYITADEKIRYERLTKRTENRDDNNKTFNDFKKDHKRKTEIDIPKIGKKADFVIDNKNSTRELYKKIDKIIKTLK